MSTTLNLADRLLAMGRKYQELGRDQDARHVLGKLAGFAELPAAVAEETQARLGEIHLKRRKLRPARRHFTTALLHQPDNPRYHYLLATAMDTRTPEEAERAAGLYEKSLELDPRQPRCLSEYGLLLVTRLGRAKEGLAALRRAVAMAPADPEVAGNLAEGLRQEGEIAEARAVLRAALFRNARDPRFHKLRSDFEFQQLRREQRAAQRKNRSARAASDGPVLLPFIRVVSAEPGAPRARKIIRRDGPAAPPRPHFPRHNQHRNHKRAL
jgi:Tfp pilus assembly protein PilF